MITFNIMIICIIISTSMLGTYASFFDPDRKQKGFTVRENYLFSFIVFTIIFGLFYFF